MVTYAPSSQADRQTLQIFGSHRSFDEALSPSHGTLAEELADLHTRGRGDPPIKFTHSFSFKGKLIVLEFSFASPCATLEQICKVSDPFSPSLLHHSTL